MPTSKQVVGRAVKTTAATFDRLRPPPSGVVVLLYHRVGRTSSSEVDLDAEVFDAQMAYLAQSANVVRLEDALTALGASTGTGSEQTTVVVTFDDGTDDFVDVAVPLLHHHGIPATMYLATSFIEDGVAFPDGGRPASWSGLADACSTGVVDIGSHTHHHRLLDRLAPEEIDAELDRSVQLIRDRLGRDAADFAYPKAVFGSADADAAIRRRFRSAAVAGTHANVPGRTDPYRLARSPIQVGDGMAFFRNKAAGGMGFEDTLRRAAEPRALRGEELVSDRRPVVAHVTTTDISLELLLGTQLEAIGRAGYEVIGISAPGPYVAALENRGVRHIPLDHSTRSMAPTQDLAAFGELLRVIRRLRPTIVHTHNPKPGVYGRIGARVARVPVVVNTVHGLYAQPDDRLRKRVLVYGAERVASSFSHGELVQNPEDIVTLERLRIPARKLTLLGNGIDLTRFDPGSLSAADVEWARGELGATSPSDVVVGLVGRLVQEKGYPEVFEAARRLREHLPNARFAVIGGDDAEKADALSATDRANAEAAGVRMLGSRDDVDRLYGGMDMFVLASHREGFPRAAMEAAAMGLPGVVTDIRGCRQVVDDGVTGVFVPPRNVAALETAIADLVRDPDRRRAMGAAARAKALEEFDVNHSVDITLATYRRLLERRGIPVPAAS